MAVIVDQLVVTLRARLADLLADFNKLLARLHDAGVNQIQFRRKCFCGISVRLPRYAPWSSSIKRW